MRTPHLSYLERWGVMSFSALKKEKISCRKCKLGVDILDIVCYINQVGSESTTTTEWGYSSAGRALEWHSRGQRFDPAYLHQKDLKS